MAVLSSVHPCVFFSEYQTEQTTGHQDMLSDNRDRESEVYSSTGTPSSMGGMKGPYDVGMRNSRYVHKPLSILLHKCEVFSALGRQQVVLQGSTQTDVLLVDVLYIPCLQAPAARKLIRDTDMIDTSLSPILLTVLPEPLFPFGQMFAPCYSSPRAITVAPAHAF